MTVRAFLNLSSRPAAGDSEPDERSNHQADGYAAEEVAEKERTGTGGVADEGVITHEPAKSDPVGDVSDDAPDHRSAYPGGEDPCRASHERRG